MYRLMFRSLRCSEKLCNLNEFKFINSYYKVTYSKRFFLCTTPVRIGEKVTNININEQNEEHNLPSALSTKYKVFRDEDAPVIFDVNEERKKIILDELKIEKETNPYEGINMTRGINGVYEIEDLIELLQRDNARQIFVATVPKEYSYVDYIVVVSGKTHRHMHALATFVRKIYKIKKLKTDSIPKIEGHDSKDWMALDLGNIALHIFSPEARIKYDLETLWSVGSQYDDISNIKEDELNIMHKYKNFLKDFQPAE